MLNVPILNHFPNRIRLIINGPASAVIIQVKILRKEKK